MVESRFIFVAENSYVRGLILQTFYTMASLKRLKYMYFLREFKITLSDFIKAVNWLVQRSFLIKHCNRTSLLPEDQRYSLNRKLLNQKIQQLT